MLLFECLELEKREEYVPKATYQSIHTCLCQLLTSDACPWAITSQGATVAGVELENFRSTSALSSASILQLVGTQKHHYDCLDLGLLLEEGGG